MSVPTKFTAGAAFPNFRWKSVEGIEVTPAEESGWRMIVVYRGAHCPLCRAYIGQLNAMHDDFQKSEVTFWALSADPLERAQSETEEEGWIVPVLCGLSEAEMRTLGLYVSSPRTPDETDRNFSEPALFVVNPAGRVQIIDVSNAPFARPDPKSLLDGIRFVQAKGYPVRGIVE